MEVFNILLLQQLGEDDMKSVNLNLKYKGDRNYLHGSDIYSVLVGYFHENNQSYIKRLAFKSFARDQVTLTFDEAFSKQSIAYGLVSGDEGVKKFYLIETSEPVEDRYPYNENLITDTAEIAQERITGESGNPYTVIENIIALTKQLNYHLSPDVSGKWLFGQIDLNASLPDSWHKMVITRKSCIADSFSRNLIDIDGKNFGEIRFIVGEP